MWYLLVPAVVLLACILLLWLYGFLAAFLVHITPTLKWKQRLAWLLIAAPFWLVDEELYAEVCTEVKWIVFIRSAETHGNRERYEHLYEVAWEKH